MRFCEIDRSSYNFLTYYTTLISLQFLIVMQSSFSAEYSRTNPVLEVFHLCQNTELNQAHQQQNWHFIEHIEQGKIEIQSVRSKDQLADILNKPLPEAEFT